MHLSHLALKDFRNYRRLDLLPEPGLFLFQGENAQGKTNLLEGVALLATSNSFHASSDREVVNWQAPERIALVAATGNRRAGDAQLEIVIIDPTPPKKRATGEARPQFIPPTYRQPKRIKISAAPKTATGLLAPVTLV